MDLKAKWAQHINTLKHDELLTKHIPCKPRPDPISATHYKRATLIAASDRLERSHASSSAAIEIKSIPIDNTQEGNLPTPKVDAQLQPIIPPSKDGNMLANMMQMMNQCMGQHLAPIIACLTALKQSKTLATWNWNLYEELYGDYGTGNVDVNSGFIDYTTPKQLTLLKQQNKAT